MQQSLTDTPKTDSNNEENEKGEDEDEDEDDNDDGEDETSWTASTSFSPIDTYLSDFDDDEEEDGSLYLQLKLSSLVNILLQFTKESNMIHHTATHKRENFFGCKK